MLKTLIISENLNQAQFIKDDLMLEQTELTVITEYIKAEQYLKTEALDILFIDIDLLSRLIQAQINFKPFYTIIISDAPEPEYLRLAMQINASELIFQPLLKNMILETFQKAQKILLSAKNKRAKKNLVSKKISFFSMIEKIGQTSLSLDSALKLAKSNKHRVLWSDFNPDSLVIQKIIEQNKLLPEPFMGIGQIYEINNLEIFLPDKNIVLDEITIFSNLSQLKKHFDYIFLDLAKNLDIVTKIALNLSDLVIYLIDLNKINFDLVINGYDYLKKANINRNAINVIVNQYDDFKHAYTKKEVEKILESRIKLLMPKDETYAKMNFYDFSQKEIPNLLTQKLDILADIISIQGG